MDSLDAPKTPRDQRRGVTPRALIVDDDPGFLEGLSEVVKREGFEVFGAESLKQAREEIAAHQPDILLIDLELPDGSGLDLLEDFGGAASPELVLITGHASVETAKHAHPGHWRRRRRETTRRCRQHR